MDEEASSWLRRAKFSRSVYHRLDSSGLRSIPLYLPPDLDLRLRSRATVQLQDRDSIWNLTSTTRRDSDPRLKSRPSLQPNRGSQVNLGVNRDSVATGLQRNPTTRSLSPLPESCLSDAFKEAQSAQKRFSTPGPQRKVTNKGIAGKIFARDSYRTRASDSTSSSTSNSDKLNNRKESSWTKYFDHGGGRVTAVETAADEFKVDLSQLFYGLKFATGAHSRIYHGIYKDEPVAMKILSPPDDDENRAIAARLEKQFTREVTHLSHLHHQNVIKLVAAFKDPPAFCVITKYISRGSLREFLHKLEHKSLSLQKLIAIALEIARGMEYIHSQGVIHRDLKPENILLDEDFHVKIADFGIACEEAYCDTLVEDQGTFRWMAPELIKHKAYGRKVDIYSFGLILWEMVAGTIPYEGMLPAQVAYAVVNKNLRPIIPPNCLPVLQALIEQCWASQSEKRPEFWQIVKVLEQFESSLTSDGTLNLVPDSSCQDHKKGLLHWIQKLSPVHPDGLSMPKPKLF
ncbi:serine/threonine/tyrosine-protein kinase HT1 [Macadamia integrifolia]|uniref:serine/threonine/tyrosine-protein kinase HT1 n=1 Tax=Macadamia integrifolia TaxID=60698 RepID=UPI001C52F794|nr:serine/threonine/tyrosine-protein kinase HT1 [Macadamia integrifolia]XP_042520959.1 serine/threonine/tyrosine-protein kinase HT1 [Macadamia integrifolia]